MEENSENRTIQRKPEPGLFFSRKKFSPKNFLTCVDFKNEVFGKPDSVQNYRIQMSGNGLGTLLIGGIMKRDHYKNNQMIDRRKSGKPDNLGENRIPDIFCPGKNYHQKISYHVQISKMRFLENRIPAKITGSGCPVMPRGPYGQVGS